MLRPFFLFAGCLAGMLLSAQSSYKAGYLIEAGGDRRQVQILDRDWVDNPTSIQYRPVGSTDARSATVEEVAEFGFNDGSLRYGRFTVQVDLSPVGAATLSTSSTPEFAEQTVFLEYLVDGEADLLSLERGDRRNFFYRLGEDNPQPLVSRRYRASGMDIRRDDSFRGVLATKLACQDLARRVKELKYRKPELTDFFARYNRCRNVESAVYQRATSTGKFSVGLRLGGERVETNFQRVSGLGTVSNIDLPPSIGIRAGLEAEYRLPFANNRWAAIAEVTYHQSRSETPGNNDRVSINYRGVSPSLGVRRYIYVVNDHAVFINGSVSLMFPINSTITYGRNGNNNLLRPSWAQGLNLGGGVSLGNRYQVEVQYAFDRNITDKNPANPTSYSSLSLVGAWRLAR